jgi:hypothetical protein
MSKAYSCSLGLDASARAVACMLARMLMLLVW